MALNETQGDGTSRSQLTSRKRKLIARLESDRQEMIGGLSRSRSADWAKREALYLRAMPPRQAHRYFFTLRKRGQAATLTGCVLLIVALLLRDGHGYNQLFQFVFGKTPTDEFYYGRNIFLNMSFYIFNFCGLTVGIVARIFYERRNSTYTYYYSVSNLVVGFLGQGVLIFFAFNKMTDDIPRLFANTGVSAIYYVVASYCYFIGACDAICALTHGKR